MGPQFNFQRVKLGFKYGIWAALVCTSALAQEPSGSGLSSKGASKVETVNDQNFEQSALGENFGALALATTDLGWSQKWRESKQGSLPKVQEARNIGLGQKVDIVVFLATRGKPLVIDDSLDYLVSIYKPDGSLQEVMKKSQCLPKGYKLEAQSLGVCDTVLTFELEDTDQRGQWVFKINMNAPGQAPLVFGTSFETY